jgi:hypothetical protein
MIPSIVSPLMRRSLYTAQTPIRLKTIALEKMIRSQLIAHPHQTIVSIVMTVIFVMIMKLRDVIEGN